MADKPAVPDVRALVALHHRAVYAYAYRLAGSVPDAEDLTQQVFLVRAAATQAVAEHRRPPAAGY